MSTQDPAMGLFKAEMDTMRYRKVWFNQSGPGLMGFPQLTIESLPENVLLDIFDICQTASYRDRAWQTLVHICRRWRHIMFSSPRHLNLQLVCDANTPMKKALGVWPRLPIVIYEWRVRLPFSGANIVSVLEHHDCICKISLTYTSSTLLKQLYKAMQKPYPVLTHLEVHLARTPTPVPAPDNFLGGSAPRLNSLSLWGIPFPALPKLLPSLHDLVVFDFWRIPHTGYIAPDTMVTALFTLTKLENLSIGFKFTSSPDRRTRPLPPPTRVVLPTLTHLKFHGASEYFEDFAAQIDTPAIGSVKTEFFNQLDFDVPQFIQFIDHTQIAGSFREAKLHFVDKFADIDLIHHDLPEGKGSRATLCITIFCHALDWQVANIAQICSKLSPFFSRVERLHIADSTDDGHTTNVTSSNWKDYVDNRQWLELFHAFSSVQHMHIPPKLGDIITSALQELTGESVMDVLPMLHDLYLRLSPHSDSSSLRQDIEPFVSSRRLSNHPVTVHHHR